MTNKTDIYIELRFDIDYSVRDDGVDIQDIYLYGEKLSKIQHERMMKNFEKDIKEYCMNNFISWRDEAITEINIEKFNK